MQDAEIREIYRRLDQSTRVEAASLRMLAEAIDQGRDRPGLRQATKRVTAKGVTAVVGAAAAVAAVTAGVAALRVMDQDSTISPAAPFVSTTVTLAPTSPADPSEPLSPEGDLSAFADRLFAAANADDRFVTAMVANRHTEITLYGTGEEAPPSIREAAIHAPAGVEILWVQVPYSRAQLKAALDLAWAHIPGATTGSYQSSFDHVELGVWPGDPETLAKLQKIADSLDTPVPIHLYAQPPMTF